MVFEIIEEKTKGVGVPQQCMRGADPVGMYQIRTLDVSGEFVEPVKNEHLNEEYITIAQSIIRVRITGVKTRWNKGCPILESGDAKAFGWDCTGCVKNVKPVKQYIFTCPKCGGHTFGTSNLRGPTRILRKGHCNGTVKGIEGMEMCGYTWDRDNPAEEDLAIK